MEALKQLSAESLPDTSGRSHSAKSDCISGSKKLVFETPEELDALSDEELIEKVETLLLERIQKGDKNALFQLGQLYFQQVKEAFSFNVCWFLIKSSTIDLANGNMNIEPFIFIWDTYWSSKPTQLALSF